MISLSLSLNKAFYTLNSSFISGGIYLDPPEMGVKFQPLLKVWFFGG